MRAIPCLPHPRAAGSFLCPRLLLMCRDACTSPRMTLLSPPHPASRRLQRHYTRALLPELYKLVGSASVFGDPVRLFHHLGLGVWSFLASPAAGEPATGACVPHRTGAPACSRRCASCAMRATLMPWPLACRVPQAWWRARGSAARASSCGALPQGRAVSSRCVTSQSAAPCLVHNLVQLHAAFHARCPAGIEGFSLRPSQPGLPAAAGWAWLVGATPGMLLLSMSVTLNGHRPAECGVCAVQRRCQGVHRGAQGHHRPRPRPPARGARRPPQGPPLLFPAPPAALGHRARPDGRQPRQCWP